MRMTFIPPTTPPRRHRLVVCAAVALTAAAAARVAAQMPGVPVLQNAFANPGTTLAANYGHVTGANAYAAAVAWAPRSARFVVSAGGGVYDPAAGGTRPPPRARPPLPPPPF